jgi:hypothetical protein
MGDNVELRRLDSVEGLCNYRNLESGLLLIPEVKGMSSTEVMPIAIRLLESKRSGNRFEIRCRDCYTPFVVDGQVTEP